MYKVKRNQYIFSSINDLLSTLEKSRRQSDREDASETEDREGYTGWYGSTTYEEAVDAFRCGRDDRKMFDTIKTKTKNYRQTTRKAMKNSVVGGQVVVPLYLQGIPTCMLQKRPIPANKIVTIYYNTASYYGVNGSNMTEGAMKVLERIIELENSGYRVDLYVGSANQRSVFGRGNDDEVFMWAVRIKAGGETFNPYKMLYPLTSPATNRRFGFRIREVIYDDWIGTGYGLSLSDIPTEEINNFFGTTMGVEVWNFEGLQKIIKNGVDQQATT